MAEIATDFNHCPCVTPADRAAAIYQMAGCDHCGNATLAFVIGPHRDTGATVAACGWCAGILETATAIGLLTPTRPVPVH